MSNSDAAPPNGKPFASPIILPAADRFPYVDHASAAVVRRPIPGTQREQREQRALVVTLRIRKSIAAGAQLEFGIVERMPAAHLAALLRQAADALDAIAQEAAQDDQTKADQAQPGPAEREPGHG